MTDDDEAKLVARCLAGEGDAVDALIRSYQGPIFRLCYRMLRHHQDAEDVVQESLVRGLRSLHRWDGRPLQAWLMAIAANRCRTLLRRAWRRRRPQGLPLDYPGPPPCDGIHELAEEVARGLERLRPEYQIVFILFHDHGMSHDEIGQLLGRPVGTVRTWLHRARSALADHLRRRGIGGEA